MKYELLQAQIQYLDERNEYLVTTINNMIENWSDDALLQFSKEQTLYELTVNGDPIPKNGQITVPAGIVEILLSEIELGYDLLPAEWFDKGKISGDNYIDHLLNFDTINWVLIGADGTVNTSRGYQSADIKAGQQISFIITEELSERLEIDATPLQIKVE